MSATLSEAQVAPRPATGAPRPSTSPPPRLAIYGGPKAAPGRYRERYRRARLRDLLPLIPYIAQGRNTIVRGGPIGKFEDRFARLTDSRYAILMNSGTAALHSAYMAVGVKPGDEVLVPTYTWFSTAAAVLQCGAAPVFCDIDPRTLTMDPADAARRISPRTRAICVVHIWGNPAALDQFAALARKHDLALIEDASHAHGARFQNRPVGSWGHIGCFSLQGTKAVSGGEAGVAVTNDPFYYDRMLALGFNLRREDHVTGTVEVDQMSLGLKYRPHLCAAVLANASLSRLPLVNRLRKRNYDILAEELADCPALKTIGRYPQAEPGGYLEFPLRYRPEHAGGWPREAFVQAAKAEGVYVDVDRYTNASSTSQLLHQAPLFNTLDRSQFGGPLSAVRLEPLPSDVRLPVAERLAAELLSMPSFTAVKEQFVREQARAMRKVVEAAQRIGDLRTGEPAAAG
jgi:dTDP-4-amino-4,6-dideoxygalactose transaminase